MPMGPLAFGAQPSPGQVLRHTGSGFDWTTLNGLTDVAGLAANRILFGSASGLIAQSANLTYTSGTGLTIADSTASTTSSTGALVVTGGLGVGGAVNITGATGIAGITSITNSTASTSTSTGALVVTGGIGVGGSANVLSQVLICNGSDTTAILCAGANNATNGTLTGTTQLSFKANIIGSSAATTGVRGFSSAAGTAAAAFTTKYVAGFFAGAATVGAASTVTSSIGYTARRQTGGTNNFGYVYTSDETTITGQFAFFSNTADASSLNGSLLLGSTTDDGVNKLQVTGSATISSATASTSTSTGALIVPNGGIGTGGQITFDGSTGKSLRVTNGVANASVAVTFGSVGPTGSTAGNAQGWLRISVNGTDRFIPFW